MDAVVKLFTGLSLAMAHQQGWLILVKRTAKNCNKIAPDSTIERAQAMRRLLLLSFLAFPVFAVDDKPPQIEAVPEVPELPLPVQSGETMEPDIDIRKHKVKDKQYVEYRRGGRLYMIKVIPDVGPPYYFLDNDGDGKMDVRSDDLNRGSGVNMWKLLEWK